MVSFIGFITVTAKDRAGKCTIDLAEISFLFLPVKDTEIASASYCYEYIAELWVADSVSGGEKAIEVKVQEHSGIVADCDYGERKCVLLNGMKFNMWWYIGGI